MKWIRRTKPLTSSGEDATIRKSSCLPSQNSDESSNGQTVKASNRQSVKESKCQGTRIQGFKDFKIYFSIDLFIECNVSGSHVLQPVYNRLLAGSVEDASVSGWVEHGDDAVCCYKILL